MGYLFVVLAVLLQLTFTAYSPKLALELAYMSAVTYNPLSQISSWTCPECKKYPVTEVTQLLCRSKPS
jgi:hypothetical protein